ncbi:MAG: RhuM family protein [Saprospiraceae bacterium]
MKMNDWIQKLDDFLKISEKKLLKNAGSISHRQAIEKANAEYKKYREAEDQKYISDFDREITKID